MKKIISVIGAGGKTTLIHRLAKEYRRKGNSVLMTTTTHMMVEADTDLSCDAFAIREKLQKEQVCMAGRLCRENPQKISMLPERVLREVIPHADYILIEADGAKHHSLKYPSDREPVILEGTTDVLLVLGTWDFGKPCGEVIFRFNEMKNRENRELMPEEAVDAGHIQRILRAYDRRLQAVGYTGRVQYIFSEKEEGTLSFWSSSDKEQSFTGGESAGWIPIF